MWASVKKVAARRRGGDMELTLPTELFERVRSGVLSIVIHKRLNHATSNAWRMILQKSCISREILTHDFFQKSIFNKKPFFINSRNWSFFSAFGGTARFPSISAFGDTAWTDGRRQKKSLRDFFWREQKSLTPCLPNFEFFPSFWNLPFGPRALESSPIQS